MIPRAWLFAAVIGASLGTGRAEKVCDLTFSLCPGQLQPGVIKVPEEAIWLDARIPYCNEYVQLATGNAKPPSIVFIIDNSGSMDENDPGLARFNVVSTLLESINAFSPGAEVGLVIFTRRLAFDHRENPYFKTAFPGDTAQHDSFVPLTALNKVFPNGRRGLDTLKSLLKHDEKGNLTYVTRLPASRDNSGMTRGNTRDGTDISLGFQGAKLAMKDSRSDKGSQYFVFLSDGTPSTLDVGRQATALYEFVLGTSVPTTFTVFFDTQNSKPVAPDSIVKMTRNIMANGYSPSNPKSAYWAINLPGSQLQGLLQNEVIGNVLSVPAKPIGATLAMGDTTYPQAAMEAGKFIFAKHLALKPDTTRIKFEFTYSYVDTTGGMQVPTQKRVPYGLTFVRSPGAPLPAGMGKNCKEQADITLHQGGLPVTRVTFDQTSLEARLTQADGSLCRGCTLEILSSTNRVKDREYPAMLPGAGYLYGSFQREVNASAIAGDGRLQHLPGDSIVLVYVSPENPLDRVRKAFPYQDRLAVLEVGPLNDYARTVTMPASPLEPQWMLVAPPTVQAAPGGRSDAWRLRAGPIAPLDSLRYLGLAVEASRAFSVDVRVYSNLGEFVNRLAFSVSQAEFEKLEKSPRGAARMLKVLWDGRTRAGAPVGTGAYVIKTSVTLLRIPGIAEDNASRIEYRRVGVLRSP